ncbi:hypothetical protein [Leeuwenhoekiella palythoae]|uniref:Uncharacterized protein n=1 Tax=Leeuwenhoekiella palythoae TaxID=573501 RepID=A0A1M5VD09_9FLAO|nr:hypothetical protein [Leeuwenhoekiella palythoae]MEC7782155.1 hypothetical protein [Bacteroidota bacterium]MEC8884335.1 hypothetical protein [Bacteroidota bacterium]RXG30868.1 hypothetical protein DSM01_2 [Leeuwenhoekiella palythoae]SHH73130.1 hypothetical protein SAMN04487999_0710 [Leeuwenhoekiella palythoae]
MKNLVIIFAFLMVLRPAFPFLEYALDYEYISTVLCENKDKPQLNCNGKCYLMQALADASEKESTQKKKSTMSSIELLPFIIEVNELSIPIVFAEETQVTFSFYPNLSARETATGLFRPPIV